MRRWLKRVRAVWLWGTFVLLAGALCPCCLAQAPTLGPDKLIDPLRLAQDFAGQPTIVVLVRLARPNGAKQVDFHSRKAARDLRFRIQQRQAEVLGSIPGKHLKLRHRFENLSGFSADVTPEGLAALQDNPEVESIQPVHALQPHLAQGIPLIHADTYRSVYNGAGVAIAICDTGIDYTHPRLGGGGFPNSKVIGGYDFGDNDSDPIPDQQAHGTACAGIAAGDLGTVGDYIGGVAPNAKLYALKITSGSSGSATDAELVAAWDWCVTHQNDDPDHPILVISTSFGGGRAYTSCDADSPSLADAANNAVAAGITILASAGNDGYCDSIAFPACISSVLAVGGVYDAAFGQFFPCVSTNSCAPWIETSGCTSGAYCNDTSAADLVPSYSNSSSLIALLAPANQCYTLDIAGTSGYSSDDYVSSFGGTSAASPYAAGAAACLQSAAKATTGRFLSVDEVARRLIENGDAVSDAKSSTTSPRVNLARAIETLPLPPSISPIPNQAIAANGATTPISFTVEDANIPADNLALSGYSSDPTLVPLANIALAGSGSTRTVTITPVANRSGSCTISIVASNGTTSATNNFLLNVSAAVSGRFIFYNHSAWDNNDSEANSNDDQAIAPDKVPLLAGGVATYANYTSYSHGINGIMVDVAGLAGTPSAGDFAFKVGNNNNPSSWSAAPAPISVALRRGAGINGTDRVTLIWTDNAIQQEWLEVSVLPTAATGLANPDSFFFGNAIAECGNSSKDATVTSADVVITIESASPVASLTTATDFNRDKKVGSADVVIAMGNLAIGPSALQLIDLTGGGL